MRPPSNAAVTFLRYRTRAGPGACVAAAQDQLARSTAASDHIKWHADGEMTTALVVPTLQNQATENRPTQAFASHELRKTG
jgi:hypothetical protein